MLNKSMYPIIIVTSINKLNVIAMALLISTLKNTTTKLNKHYSKNYY